MAYVLRHRAEEGLTARSAVVAALKEAYPCTK